MEQKAKTDPASEHETQGSQADRQGIVLMRGLRSFAYGLLAVLLPVALARSGETPAAIGTLITVSLLGDFIGTYVISLIADSLGRRRTLVLLALVMAGTGIIFGLIHVSALLLVAAFFGTLGTSASETAPFLPVEQAMLSQTCEPRRRTVLFAHYNLVATLAGALGALTAGLPDLLTRIAIPLSIGIHLLFGMYTAIALVVAWITLRLSPAVETPSRLLKQAGGIFLRLVPPLG